MKATFQHMNAGIIQRSSWIIIGIILFLRLLFIWIMGIMPQDAYYHFYGEHLALSYFDHPPMIAYLLRLSTWIFGKKVFALKLMDSLISTLSLYFFFLLSRRFLNTRMALIALVLYFSTLLVSVLSLVSTPDTPLILFWTLSLYFLHKALSGESKINWLLAGLMMGLAFDSKYTALLLPAGLICFCLISANHRIQLLRRWLWLSLLLFVFTASPVIIWNIQNHFASFRFQSADRMQSMSALKLEPLYLLGLIGHQSALLMPVLFFAIFLFLWKSFRRFRFSRIGQVSESSLFLLSFFLPLFLGFLSISIFYWVKLNWMMPAYVSGIIWISRFFSIRLIKYQLAFSLMVHIAIAVEIIFYPFRIRSDDTWVGWKTLAEEITSLQKIHPGHFIFSSNDYKTAAVLNFYLPEMIYSQNVVGKPALQFDYVGSDLNLLNGRNALFIDSKPGFEIDNVDAKPGFLLNYFDSVSAITPIFIFKEGKAVRKFSIYECFHYRHGGKALARNP